MTREEAIKTLRGEAWICCGEKWNEALEMASKALEQEPIEDVISRQAVMDCFKKWQPYMATRLWDFEQELSNLLPVTPAENPNKWILVSERLPEKRKEVLTCSLGGFIEIQSVEHDYWENQHGDWSDLDEVVAWMPLPEPYKAESEE